jgi:hypothetical protein
MMTRYFSAKATLCAGVAAMGLSACGGSTSNTATIVDTPDNAFQTLGANAESLQSRVTNLPGAAFSAVPSTGTATFTGNGEVTMVLDAATDQQFRALGDASVTVNFETQAVTGGLTNLMGAVGSTAEVASGSDAANIVDVAGSVDLSNGDIFELRRNRFGVDYAGTLTAGGTAYVLGSRALGEFNGTREDPANGFSIKAVEINDAETAFATVTNTDGTTTTFAGTVGLFGETR